MQPQLTPEGERLVRDLDSAEAQHQHTEGDKIHVSGVAGTLYFAYEQLRNIAEYTEQHLILRATIERFLKRHMQFTEQPKKLGFELVEELTQERYLSNNTTTQYTVDRIDAYIDYYIKLHLTLHNGIHHVSKEETTRWTIQAASVAVEQQLSASPKTEVFINFAYAHCMKAIDRSDFERGVTEEDFSIAVYCATHRALIKSDIATTRASYINANPESARTIDEFIRVNRLLDKLFDAPLTTRLSRLISRNGAPLRIIREVAAQTQGSAQIIQQPAKLISYMGAVADEQYQKTHNRLVKSIIRTLIFVFITKAAIGLLIEIPYDIWKHGTVLITPLLVNMIFPPLYMATAIWAVKKPDQANTDAIRKQIERILYSGGNEIHYRIPKRDISTALRLAFRLVYTLAYAASFGLAVWLLLKLDFSWVHIGVFFMFFSAVSFFRFRLIQQSRELDINDRRESIFAIIADFFYTPFIKLGEWLSARYRRINVVTVILDLMIEMPLKTTLRILQEWVRFMRDKREGF
jgi:hypothetical protein